MSENDKQLCGHEINGDVTRPCALVKGHKYGHKDREQLDRHKANEKARYDADPTAKISYMRDRREDPEVREHERQRIQAYREGNPEYVERNREGTRDNMRRLRSERKSQ